MRYLCVAIVVGLLAIGFSTATPDMDLYNYSAALESQGCSPVHASLINHIKPRPQVEEVKEWLEYFESDVGGKFSRLVACDNACQVFNGTHFDGPHPDLATFKAWVAYIFETSGHLPGLNNPDLNNHANSIATHFLSMPHPQLENVKALGAEGIGASRAFQILNITPRPLLHEVEMWLDYFGSDMGGLFNHSRAYSNAYQVLSGSNLDGTRKGLAILRMWVEYFCSEMGGGSKTYKSANVKAINTLSSPHTNLAVTKMWVTYLASQEGGNMHSYELANQDALRILGEPHPCLEDLKLWAKFYMGPEGGHLLPHLALKTARHKLEKEHPDLECLKNKAAHYYSPSGGDHSHSSSLVKAFEACKAKEPVLSDAKVCDGEGDKEEESSDVGFFLLVMFICCGCGCSILTGAVLIYKRSRQEGMRTPDLQVEMNAPALFLNAAPTESSKDPFSCGACGSNAI